MFTIDNDTNAMTIIKKDTASFDVALDNYNLEDGHLISTCRGGTAPYENTKFGQLEEFLKSSNVKLESLK